MSPTDHLAHELTYIDDQILRAANRNAWLEVDAWQVLREQIRETRSILMRLNLPPPDKSSRLARALDLEA